MIDSEMPQQPTVFGQKFIARLKELGLTRAEAARRANIDYSTLHRAEKGTHPKHRITKGMIEKLAPVIQLPVSTLTAWAEFDRRSSASIADLITVTKEQIQKTADIVEALHAKRVELRSKPETEEIKLKLQKLEQDIARHSQELIQHTENFKLFREKIDQEMASINALEQTGVDRLRELGPDRGGLRDISPELIQAFAKLTPEQARALVYLTHGVRTEPADTARQNQAESSPDA